jgi:3-deoxy-D-manno-octulosonate 8-phosphate phosphatase (KDO 8-P phosphatase)
MQTEKLKAIRLLLLDVDGVMTDGRIVYGNDETEFKQFDVKDGLGIKLLKQAGIEVGVVTGRKSEALARRCRELGIDLLFESVRDKGALLPMILKHMHLKAKEIAFIGDDIPDLALMHKIGLAIAVADAHAVVRQHADWITQAKGGRGAVREVCELILQAQGRWQRILKEIESSRHAL